MYWTGTESTHNNTIQKRTDKAKTHFGICKFISPSEKSLIYKGLTLLGPSWLNLSPSFFLVDPLKLSQIGCR